jgi:aminomethyltransferase
MVEFSGWEMPVQYPGGIVAEHLATRRGCGLFDVSHMGRFVLRGAGTLGFLQHVLSSNVEALDIRTVGAQYTFIPNEGGGAVDDAFVYRFSEAEYLLVVNAANAPTDWAYLSEAAGGFRDARIIDGTEETVMLALQGPASRRILADLIQEGSLPEPLRNTVSSVTVGGARVRLARTGYTGEPLCFELFVDRAHGAALWDLLVQGGATPAGLGARDTLRLEAGLPLYGHELGRDPEGGEIPIMACPLARFAVSFSPFKGPFVGREALQRQHLALERIMNRDYSLMGDLPRLLRPVAVLDRGVARRGARVLRGGKPAGTVTSGTMVPYWVFEGEGMESAMTDRHAMRAICLAYLDSDVLDDERVAVEVRNQSVEAVVVPYHLRSEAPPYARPIVYGAHKGPKVREGGEVPGKVLSLLQRTVENSRWRQESCINLIPSEMTVSPMVRLLSIMDPAFRYAEHKESKAFYDAEIFYYQGTGFIKEVEERLEEEMAAFLGCREVETRLVSGQMANTAVFSAMVDFLNRADRKAEPRRMRRVMHHHIVKGGHLSAQPMGALRDFVARDPHAERPAVVAFPVLPHNPYQVDVGATLELIDAFRPELIVFGKSLFLHREPVAEVRRFVDDQGIDTVVMYDMAHVLGLVGPHFQEPFAEGAHLVTGSTHKTFFGTQRGVVGSMWADGDDRWELWEALRRRTFPGSVSNHHLGTLLGLLMAAYEMNHFKGEYQPRVIANAKAFARALRACGLEVAGDPALGFTETHQVVVHVGYAQGPEMARRLEANHIICNFQAGPDEEGFTASGALRMGVSEMTRFGMGEGDFGELASLIRDVIRRDARVGEEVKALRRRFLQLRYCFEGDEYTRLLAGLRRCV